MIETPTPGYLEVAIASMRAAPAQGRQTVLPFHKALVDFEMLKLELAMAPRGAHDLQCALRPGNSQLAHTPLMLASTTRLMCFDYAVHRRNLGSAARKHCSTRLLIYRLDRKTIAHMELEVSFYTMVLALKLGSEQGVGLAATELLLDLADYHNPDNVVHFVDQGLKLLGRLNDLGLMRTAA